jgi:hypothetical protein
MNRPSLAEHQRRAGRVRAGAPRRRGGHHRGGDQFADSFFTRGLQGSRPTRRARSRRTRSTAARAEPERQRPSTDPRPVPANPSIGCTGHRPRSGHLGQDPARRGRPRFAAPVNLGRSPVGTPIDFGTLRWVRPAGRPVAGLESVRHSPLRIHRQIPLKTTCGSPAEVRTRSLSGAAVTEVAEDQVSHASLPAVGGAGAHFRC